MDSKYFDRVFRGRLSSRLAAAMGAIALVVGLAGTSGATDFRAGKLSLSDLAPDDCLAYVSLSGLEDWSSRLEEFSLYKLWEEPDVQSFLKEGLEALPGLIRQRAGSVGVELQEITGLVQGRVEVVAGDLTMVAVEDQVMVLPGAVLALDLGNRKDEFLKGLDHVLGQVSDPQQVRQGRFEYRDVVVRTFSPPASSRRIPVFDLQICTAVLDNLFLVGLNPPYLKRVIDNHHARNAATTLASNPSFKRCVAKTGGDPFLSAYINVQGLRGMIEKLIPAEIDEIGQDLGLDSVQALYLGSGEKDGTATDVFYVDAPGEKKGLLKVLSMAPCEMKALELAPENIFAFVSLNLDLHGAKEEIFRLLGKYVPEAISEVKQEMAQASRQVGLDIENDVLAALTGEVNLCAGVNPLGAMIPDVMVTLGIRDQKKFDKVFGHCLEMAGDQIRTHSMDHKGQKIDYVSIPGAPVMPAYRVQDGQFLITVSPLMMKNILAGANAKRESGDLDEALAACESTPRIFSYADIRPLVSMAYNTVLPWVQGAVPPEVPFDMALLPTSDVIVKHLSPQTSSYVVDDTGLLLSSQSSLGASFLLSLLARVVDHFGETKVQCPVDLSGAGLAHAEPQHHDRETARRESPAKRERKSEARSERHEEHAVAEHSRRSDRESHAEKKKTRGDKKDAEKKVAQKKKKPRSEKKAARSYTPEEAQSLYASGNFKKAIEAYTSVLESDPNAGGAYFFRGYSHYQLGEIESFLYNSRKAAENGFRPGTSYYNVACGYSLLGKKEPALKYLALAIENGFTDLNHMRGDSDLDTIRNEKAYADLMKKIN